MKLPATMHSHGRWLPAAAVTLLAACQSGPTSTDPTPTQSITPAAKAPPAPPMAKAPAAPSRPATPAGWHEGLSVADKDLATVQDFEEEAQKSITPKSWQAELEKLAKEIGE